MTLATLLFLFLTVLVLLTSGATSKKEHHHHNKADNSNKKRSTRGAAQAFSTIVQTRLQQSKQRALAQRQALLRLFDSKLRDPTASSWWEDLSPSPFRLLLPEEQDALFAFAEQEEDPSQLGTNTSTAMDVADPDVVYNNNDTATVTHFCFLVHGHRGLSQDLSYVQHVMRRNAAPQRRNGGSFVVHSVTCNEKKTDDGVAAGGERLVTEILDTIRETMKQKQQSTNITANNNNNTVTTTRDVTISILGNSLGGLYARYAISRLKDRCLESCWNHTNTTVTTPAPSSSGYCVLDDAYTLHLNTFCTTATPHLGIAGHTFLPLPRSAEIGVALAMGMTGKDLFRLNPLLWEMATQDRYLEPLRAFRQRIAYANAFGTDFPVPAATAAFLSESSAYPHHVQQPQPSAATPSSSSLFSGGNLEPQESSSEETEESETEGTINDSMRSTTTTTTTTPDVGVVDNPLVVATLHTRSVEECEDAKDYYESMTKRRRRGSSATSLDENNNGGECRDDLDESYYDDADDRLVQAQMSSSLDSLGWKKVFVDMRKGVPKISIPKTIPKVLRRGNGGGFFSSMAIFDGSTVEEEGDPSLSAPSDAGSSSEDVVVEQPINVEPIHQLKTKGILSSKEVAASVLTTALPDEELAFHWPMGHNMIVAFSRSRWSTKMYKAGRPLVDTLAKELVDDILAFENEALVASESSRAPEAASQ